MGWRFARGVERLQCEARNGRDAGSYELAITLPDGIEVVERYPDEAALLRRQHELMQAWKAQGWRELAPEAETVQAVRGR